MSINERHHLFPVCSFEGREELCSSLINLRTPLSKLLFLLLFIVILLGHHTFIAQSPT